MNILVVEDELDLAESMSGRLRSEGYLCSEAHSRAQACDKLASTDFDLVVLDITLPDGNGLSILEQVRDAHPRTATIIVSARDALEDRLAGLDLGADDYLTKPFHLSELQSRVKAILRRRNFDGRSVLSCGQVELDADSRTATCGGKPLDLTPREYVLLLYFVVNQNRVLTRESLAAHVWGDDLDLIDSFDFIYTHIKNLRRKLQETGGSHCIQTIYGVGYKMSDP